MKKLTLQESRVLYVRTGFCEHDFISTFELCGIEITQCEVCAEETEPRIYVY